MAGGPASCRIDPEVRLARLKPLWLELSAIARRVRAARRMLIASDYDGTLTPIVEHPDRAGLDARTRRVVARLVRTPGVRVAILSGRRLAEVRRRVRVRGLYLSGVVGFETQSPGGRLEVHVPKDRTLPPEIRPVLEAWCAHYEGAWVEDKRWSLAVHYRQVAPRTQVSFAAGVRGRLAPFRGRLQVVPGKKALEILPAVAWNKALALERWWDGGPGALLVYVGDDENDEPVHTYVRKQGGIGIAVGRRTSRAEFSLQSSEEVTWWLEWLAREWER
jgi:trehalose-phosphatase